MPTLTHKHLSQGCNVDGIGMVAATGVSEAKFAAGISLLLVHVDARPRIKSSWQSFIWNNVCSCCACYADRPWVGKKPEVRRRQLLSYV